jgi:hypothetical protein
LKPHPKFCHHIGPVFQLICQDSGYTSGTLWKPAQRPFETLKTQLSQEQTLAFPRADRKYVLITNAYKPTQALPKGLGTTLAQLDMKGNVHIISHALRQLKENAQ